MGRDPKNPVFQFVPTLNTISVRNGPSASFGTNVPYIESCIQKAEELVRFFRNIFSSFLKLDEINVQSELKTLECDIINPDLLINPEINNMRRTSNI